MATSGSTERTPLLRGQGQPASTPRPAGSPPSSPLSSAFAGLTAANGESAEQQELASSKLGARTGADLALREKTVILFGCTLACFLSVSPGGKAE